jgi:hypothetical protein
VGVKRNVKRTDKEEKLLTKAREELINLQEATVEKQNEINRTERRMTSK